MKPGQITRSCDGKERVTQLFSGFNALQAIYLNHRPSPELLPKDPALLKSTAINPLNTKGKRYQFYNGV
ncbi:Coatomer Subunit Beta [Manis pentadactyla]|nr:Coatomer Subunit Beta [Manis pentadactyla]